MNLFETMAPNDGPLAERLRPKALEDLFGQNEVLRFLQPYLESGRGLPNLILWGPPGCGKTTLAKMLAERSGADFITLNAIATGAKELREVGDQAHLRKIEGRGRTLIFIDEIHRLNRAQQDVLLPFTEAGDFTLIGATTENPGYELNSALLSRARVVVLKRLEAGSLNQIYLRGCQALAKKPYELLSQDAQLRLLSWADGDARKLLTSLDMLNTHSQVRGRPLNSDDLSELLQDSSLRYDKNSDEHYDTISAFIKSIRGSAPDAAIYYLARMLAGGESPTFIARRLVILSSEDIGNADPRALSIAISGLQAVELVGMPEAAICLSQVVTYLSCAPKSNSSYLAIKAAQSVVEKTSTLPIPTALKSSRTALAKQLGYGEGYKYAHDGPTGWQAMEFLPKELAGHVFYEPTDRGFEKTMRQYLEWMTQKKSSTRE